MPNESPHHIIFLTGAPDPNALDWAESGLLPTTTLLHPLRRYLDGHDDEPASCIKSGAPLLPRAAWRVLPLQDEPLKTGYSQGVPLHGASILNIFSANAGGTPSFNNTTSEVSVARASDASNAPSESKNTNSTWASTDDEVLSRFHEHSLAVHQEIASSQILLERTSLEDDNDHSVEEESTGISGARDGSTIVDTDSFMSSSSADAAPYHYIPRQRIDPGHVTSIVDIPSISYLNQITPQTMTVNLIVGIITAAPARIVRARRTGAELSVVELLVGDETRAGFRISIWLPHPYRHPERANSSLPTDGPMTNDQRLEQDNLAAVRSGLRPQDIVLAQNVALSSFQGRVYGQSLRRGITKLHLLHRPRASFSKFADHGRTLYTAAELDRDGDDDPSTVKVRAVHDWLLEFVGTSHTSTPSTAVRPEPAIVAVGSRHPDSFESRVRMGIVKRAVLPADTP